MSLLFMMIVGLHILIELKSESVFVEVGAMLGICFGLVKFDEK